jgi:hypothetical protein
MATVTGEPYINWHTKGNIQEHDPPGWGSLKNTVRKKLMSPVGLRRERLALAMSGGGKDWKLQTRLLVREGAPHHYICNCLAGPSWCLTPRQTGRLTVGCTITWLDLTLLFKTHTTKLDYIDYLTVNCKVQPTVSEKWCKQLEKAQ